MLTVIIPSHNEENHIPGCLDAVITQKDLRPNHAVQVIVAANGCSDRTVPLAKEKEPALKAAGFDLVVLDILQGNKMNALNEAEAVATYDNRVFLDADVIIGPTLLAEMAKILAEDAAVYASGTVRIQRTQSLITRAYAKVWTHMPFVRDGVPGIGLYAVNAKGRARWGRFPAIIADDRFVRLQFAPQERRKTRAMHDWPLPEGFANLVNVRHRWREGNLELAEKYPALLANDSEINTSGSNIPQLFRTPFSSVVFVLVYVVSNIRAKRSLKDGGYIWRRGRN
ncbi:glycosyltransferase [Yoonia sp. R78084]|uniref:glycosyltransferase n=1 Tax=Yoonia sp. R78084 TaxID=3093869 RepID=UPI0037DC09BB